MDDKILEQWFQEGLLTQKEYELLKRERESQVDIPSPDIEEQIKEETTPTSLG